MLVPSPLHAVLTHQAEIGFVNQGSRLQGAAGPFLQEMAPGNLAQFLVDDRNEFRECLRIAVAPASQQVRHLAHQI